MKKNITIVLVLAVIILVVIVSSTKKMQEAKMQNATVFDSFGTTSRQDTTEQIDKNISDIEIKTNSSKDFEIIDSGIKEI